MYVCREYSFNGSRSSQTTPMTTRIADRYGGTLSKRGSLRNAKTVGASIVVSVRLLVGADVGHLARSTYKVAAS